jgi:hypothetical protein
MILKLAVICMAVRLWMTQFLVGSEWPFFFFSCAALLSSNAHNVFVMARFRTHFNHSHYILILFILSYDDCLSSMVVL